uniref:CCHC-type domain-containing protein n=1 Tax=Photinus pyralis TaxID=7054 RepID=A0A1Y1MQW7_PHOPY
MDRLERARRPVRRQLKKLCDDINVESQNTIPDLDQMRVNVLMLEDTHRELQILDDTIKNQMLDDNVDDDQQNEEFDDIAQYKKMFQTARRVFEVLRDENCKSITENENLPVLGNQRNFKLPKFNYKKFNGEVKESLGFWSQFKKIDEDITIHDSDKFQFLVQLMVDGSRAHELVCSYPQTAENYPKAVKALKERFGREEFLVEVYVREMLKLIIHNVSQTEKQGDLSKLYDQLESHLRALESLKVTSDKYDAMLYPMVESCLPANILQAWQRSAEWKDADKTTNKLNKLMQFLRMEVEGEQRISLAQEGFGLTSNSSNKVKNVIQKKVEKIPTAMELHSGNVKSSCGFCEKSHDTQDCFIAQGWSLEDRKQKLKETKRCFTCLRFGHRSKSCKYRVKCIVCSKRHYVILCPDLQKSDTTSESRKCSEGDKDLENLSTSMASRVCSGDVILQTLRVKVLGKNTSKEVRAFIDPGAQFSYILKSLALELGYSKIAELTFSHNLFGGASTVSKTHKKYKLYLESLSSKFKCHFDVYDEDNICGGIPKLLKANWTQELHERGIVVNDVGSGSHKIEVLIGGDIYGKLLTGKLHQLESGLTAIETLLGWTVLGKVKTCSEWSSTSMIVTSMLNSSSTITNLWDLEKIGIDDPCEKLTKAEVDDQVREHFRQTVSRDSDGRYQISLPWLDDHAHARLPTNKFVAQRRLENATQKLKADGKYMDYEQVFKQWLNLDVIEEVKGECVSCHYLPHRPVYKPDSSTTKVRPVFDASCCSAGGASSLNQCLAKGPNLLELIPDLLLRFREKSVAATADIEKAFLMIGVKEDDRNFLRFLWWEDSTCSDMKIYRHKRVVFGVNCSPFLLSAVIEYHLRRVDQHLRSTADKLLTTLYVDNVVACFDNVEEYMKFKNESTRIMAEAKFCLRMWESNVDDFLEQLVVTNVLGMKWNRRSDTLSCFVNVKGVEKATTKRIILAEVAKIFDPLGILAPVTLVPKLLLQETWNSKLGWDESVSSEVSRKFLKWKHDIALLNLLEIPRWACRGNKQSWTLHTFCDASKSGYAATVFLRSEVNGIGVVQLLMAKSRVAPLKDITINRLELISCEIGSRLCQTVENSLKLDDVNRYFWTDSTTALSWIKRNDNWGTFVGNRVKKILLNTEPEEWCHVPGSLNPADLPSRGCDARSLLESKWWEGPAWLKDIEQWPINKYVENEDEVQQERKRMVTAFNTVMDEIPWYFPTKCILLPSRHPVVDALIHEDKCHAGAQYIVSHLREKVWILKGRKAIQHVVRNCVKYRRFRGKPPDQSCNVFKNYLLVILVGV